MGIEKADALGDIEGVIRDSQNPPLSGGVGDDFVNALYSECIRRLAPPVSAYRTRVDHGMSQGSRHYRRTEIHGALYALRANIMADRLKSF
jgi:hypothetical protein